MQGMIKKREGKRGTTYQVIITYKDAGGRFKKLWKTARSKREAEELRNELLVQAQRGIDIDPEQITFGEFLDKWLKDFGRTNLAPRTLESYISIIERHLKPELGAIPLRKLTPAHLREFYSRSLESGRRDNKVSKRGEDGNGGLTANTVHHFHRLIHLVLEHAVKWELVWRNVADAVDPPRRDNESEEEAQGLAFLTEDQVKILLDGIRTDYAWLPAYIALKTGTRLGETLGLRWEDVDLTHRTITIMQTLQTVNREIRVKRGAKTKKSRRTIDIPDTLVEVLKKHRLEQKKNRLAFGELYQDSGLVCTKEDGSPIKPSSFASHFVAVAKRAGLDISFHVLRHTHASLLIKAGIYPKILSERLGHSDIGTTYNVYGHLMAGAQREAAVKIDEAIPF